MRSEEKLWALLQGPSYYAHKAGEEMRLLLLLGSSRTRKSAMFKLADHHLAVIIDVFDREERCRIIKTWLTDYELPLDACKLTSFDKFYEIDSTWVLENADTIKSY